MCCCELHLSRDQTLYITMPPESLALSRIFLIEIDDCLASTQPNAGDITCKKSNNFLLLISDFHPPLPALQQEFKDSSTAISRMGCAFSHPHHDQRPECRQRQGVRPHRGRQGREEPRGPHRKRQGSEEPQGERREGDERHMTTEEEEEWGGARCGPDELHREQRERAEPPTKRSGQERLRKGQRVPREPHRERRKQKNLCAEMRRRVDVVNIGWAHPYVRQGVGFKYHKARRMRDEARRERYEPVRQAKENFRRQYDEYKRSKGVTADPQRIVPAPQMTQRDTVMPSPQNLSGMTLVN